MHVLAFVGMTGSGKSAAAQHLKKKNIPTIRFGQIIIDEVVARGLAINPKNEQMVREELRQKYGMDVCAKLSLPFIQEHMQRNSAVIIDGLYSFSEYKTLKKEIGAYLTVIAVFTPRERRYARLATREERPLTSEEAEARDYREIEQIEKGGPIAIADYTILNDFSLEHLFDEVDRLFAQIVMKH